MIDNTDLFDAFILKGLKDIPFPYMDYWLSNSLSSAAKVKFLRAKNLALTRASDLEKIDSRHSLRHLGLWIDSFI